MKMAIFGLGASGLSTLKYFFFKKIECIAIDSKPVNLWDKEIFNYLAPNNAFCEKEIEPLGSDYTVILSPGIPRTHPLLKNVKEMMNEGELFYEDAHIPVIAITGTNGKTTTTTLMGEAFKKAGFRPFVGGNIGVPIVNLLLNKDKYDIAILELSSFQLESSKSLKADVGVILNITPNHMERYQDFCDYKKAKLNIFNNSDDECLAIISPSLKDEVTLSNKILLNDFEMKKTMSTFDFSSSKLLGDHNKENLYVVLKTLERFKVKNCREILQDIISSFKGVPFRLAHTGAGRGFDFYNDAKSTNSDATHVALKSLSPLSKKVRLILGGKLRDDHTEIKDSLLPFKEMISKIYLIGEAQEKLKLELQELFPLEEKTRLNDVFINLEEGDNEVVLFSPAFPSFDQYKNYGERGEAFNLLVKNYLDV